MRSSGYAQTMAIVVGVDGSSGGDVALRWALDEARLRGTELRVVHAFELPTPPLGAVPVGAPGAALGGLTAEEQERHRRTAEEHAQAVVDAALERADAGRSGVAVQAAVVEGNAGRSLVAAARDAEMLVVGSHGHGAVRELLLGSVSHACTRNAMCPVVVLPPVEAGERS
jgi:nucleotide-binding universal stress UspA family protein